MVLIISIENIKNCGEDSYFQEIVKDDVYVMAVFDGVGGEKGGEEASEKAKEITQCWFHEFLFQRNPCQLNREKLTELKNNIEDELKKLSQESKQQSRLRGSLAKRSFSTTMALAAISELKSEGNKIQLDLVWIGDSRIYFLTSHKGLQQLTLDDLKERQDGFKSKSGMPLSKTLSANMEPDWELNFKSLTFSSCGFIIACTDGVFEDIKPWQLEQLLLDNLVQASSKDEWQNLMTQHYQNYKTDDVTMILLPVGFEWSSSEEFSEIKETFKHRHEKLIKLINNYPPQTSSSDQSIWQEYSQNYEEKLYEQQLITTHRKPVTTCVNSERNIDDKLVDNNKVLKSKNHIKQNEEKNKYLTGDIRQEETEQERTIKEYLGKGREHFLGGENQQAIGIFEKLVKDEYIIKRYPNYYIEALSSLVLAYDREANLETTQLLFTKPDSRFTENAQKNLHKILDIFDKHESICSSDNILVLVRVLVEVINLKQILLEDETKKEFVKNLCERIPEYGESQELLGKINSSQAKFFFQKAIEIYIRKNQNNSAKRCQKKLNKMTEKPLIIFSNKLKLLIIIIAVFTILSFTAGIVFAVIMALPNSLSIHSENVKIKGNYLLSDESIREILPLSSSPSIFRIQPRALETDLLDKLPIDSAVVIRQIFPPALTIEVTERLPVAIALNSEEGNQKLLGFLDSKGKIIVSEKLPNLKVIGLPEQYRYDWQKMYESLMIYQGVIIYEIDWQNADNIILTTEIGLVHLGYNNALFQEQLRVLEKMKEEDKRANNLSYIDLTDPSNPKIVDFSNIDSEYSPSNTTLNFNTK